MLKRGLNMEKLKLNNLPIRYKLIIHFLLISILPSIGLGLLIGWTVDRIVEERSNENTMQLIGKVNSSLENEVEDLQKITYLISFDPGVQAFLNGSMNDPAQAMRWAEGREPAEYNIRKFLQGFTTLSSEIAGIMLVNREGEFISNEMYTRPGTAVKSEAWYKEAENNKGIFKIIGHPYGRAVRSHVDYKESEVVSAVRAIVDPETQVVQGVVLIDLKLRVIAETARDVTLGKTGYLTIVDSSGEMIYAPQHPFMKNIPKGLLTETSGITSETAAGRHLQLIYRTSSFTGWTTVGVFPMEESAFGVREITFNVVTFVFIVCMLGMTASFYLAHSISRPIGQLASFMSKAQSGDLTIRYWGNRSDEIGLLGRSFNSMLAQISRLLSLTELQARQKREAELRSLQAHIKPHFLYNTLDTIHWMARNKGADDIAEVVQSLSKLFRLGLSKGSDLVPLSDELEHMVSYLKIQQVRYSSKLAYRIEVEPQLDELYVLKLLLQPIVENAIYHGIKERRGPGHISIEVAQQAGELYLTVRDDGAGMTPERLAMLQKRLAAVGSNAGDTGDIEQPLPDSAGSGYGILNVQARIRLTYGEPYGLQIESERGVGTVVTVRHPVVHDSYPVD
ncbi:histidine kinase [Paenibacillus sp. P3E]|uniref:cache domain-containing sensor histidine kinase n=1 Tax=unclassified Paenibacillus TaxID=185978 RepID=UPI00093D94B0|nr:MULTISPECIES: sensor histidine kinase [unclassified Paenibacillus]OKP69827.1 histidine kinase [Paenibacillus sp. P3E]OKP82631.1 histidine kinase [Paenibacillus sp. P32E]